MNRRRSLRHYRLWLGVLLIAANLAACSKPAVQSPPTPTPATVAEAATPTEPPAVSPPTVTPEPTAEPATATPEPTAPPPTATLPPTVAPTKTPTVAPTAAGLSIVSFTCGVSDAATGKHLAFAWQTTGATKARIYSGTSMRFPPAWDVPANGTFAVDVQTTYYRDPSMTLVAYDASNKEVKKSITVQWACQYNYFFVTSLGACPSGEAMATAAAQEAFQNGQMVWLQQIPAGSSVLNKQIVVLYNDKSWAQFNDTWSEGEPETDPSITAPAGLLQPKRGFGKLWRENAAVKSKLGWALAAEQGYSGTWQWQMRESLPSVGYLRLIDNQVVELSGQGTGSWKMVAP